MEISARTRAAIIFGAVLGIGLVLVAWLAWRDDRAAENPAAPAVAPTVSPTSAPATTTTAAGPEFWADPHETLLGPTALVPRSLTVDDDQLAFDYDLVNTAPLGDGASITVRGAPQTLGELDLSDVHLVLPTSWTLVTDRAEIPYRPINPGSGVARFDVPVGFTTDQVRGVRLEGYRLPIPFRVPLDIAADDAGSHVIAPGIEARINTLLEQGTGWLIVIEVEAEDGGILDDLTVEGVGVDWTRATGSLLGTSRWTMEYQGAVLPDPIPFEARGRYWAEIDRAVDVDLSGVVR